MSTIGIGLKFLSKEIYTPQGVFGPNKFDDSTNEINGN
jgi:hypothetical protein